MISIVSPMKTAGTGSIPGPGELRDFSRFCRMDACGADCLVNVWPVHTHRGFWALVSSLSTQKRLVRELLLLNTNFVLEGRPFLQKAEETKIKTSNRGFCFTFYTLVSIAVAALKWIGGRGCRVRGGGGGGGGGERENKIKLLVRWFHFEFRIQLLSVTVMGTWCREHHQASQLA